MTDPLARLIDGGASELERAIETGLPRLAPRALSWLRSLTTTGHLADYFGHPSRFPMLALPWWAAGDSTAADQAFHRDVAVSTMAGYWYVRLIDDLVDRAPGATVELLPLTALLHTEFHGRYQTHFPPGSPFWDTFRERWLAAADATVAGAGPAPDNPEALVERATDTIGAVAIPLRAVLLRAGRDRDYPRWLDAVHELARIEQLIDDLVDWQQDHERGLPNVLLAEAGRRGHRGAAVPGWVVLEGYRWGLDHAAARLEAAAPIARELDCPSVGEFLRRRRDAVSRLDEATMNGLSQLAALAGVFDSPSA